MRAGRALEARPTFGSIWTPFGWIFASGYWDYYWPSRGLLYPALYFGFQFPYLGYIHHPYYCLRVNPLANGLYVNPLASHYYYGNYAGANFRQWGLQPWANYSARAYDPIFAHERIASPGSPGLQTQPLSGVNSASLLTTTQQLHNSGGQFTQLTSAQRQTQLQGAQQLLSQSQQFSQQASRNFAANASNFSRGISTSNFHSSLNPNFQSNFGSSANFIPRAGVPNFGSAGTSWANHPSFSSGSSGFARPSFSGSSHSTGSFSSHSSSSSSSSGGHGHR